MRAKKARAERIKGKIVEQIVEQMHRVRGVVTQRNVRLASVHNPKRRREIDVLVTGHVLGYAVRFAFECKNHDRAADVAKIGEFADKLSDVGIAPQQGIFVSARGFTDGALDRARQLGMQVLQLAGLQQNRLASLVIDALQSVVFLLPVVTEWRIVNDIAQMNDEEAWLWFGKDGKLLASTPDLLWHRWRDGEPPSTIGVHRITVEAPGWSQRVGGTVAIPQEVSFTVQVVGLAITMTGRATDHALVDAFNQHMKRRQVDVAFDAPEEDLPLRVFESEEDFRSFLSQRPEALKVISRVRLPRLSWNGLFWPISARAHSQLEAMVKSRAPGQAITPEDLARIEGSFASVWEAPATIPPKPGAT